MIGYVYILRDRIRRFYIGSTDNIARRIRQHENGYARTTARMMKPELVLAQKYEALAQARKIELRIKKLKRKDYIERMISEGKINMR